MVGTKTLGGTRPWEVSFYSVSLLSSPSVQVKMFLEGLFHLNHDIPAFKEHLRDFLVQIKVCS